MPVEYRIDSDRRLVVTRAWGVLTEGEIIAHYARLRDDPAFRGVVRQVVDLRDVTDATRVRGDVPRRSWPARCPPVRLRRAFVAPPGYVFGVARQNAAYAELDGLDAAVFDSVSAAETWLGLESGGSGLCVAVGGGARPSRDERSAESPR